MKPGWAGFILSLLMYGLCNAESAWARELYDLDNAIEKDYKKKYQILLDATGGGGIQGFHLYAPEFTRCSSVTKDQALELILQISEDLLNRINSDPVLVGGMTSYPFTPKNLGVAIFFRKRDGSFVDIGEPMCIGITSSKIQIGYQTEYNKKSKWEYLSIFQELQSIDDSRTRFPYLWECVEKSGAGK